MAEDLQAITEDLVDLNVALGQASRPRRWVRLVCTVAVRQLPVPSPCASTQKTQHDRAGEREPATDGTPYHGSS